MGEPARPHAAVERLLHDPNEDHEARVTNALADVIERAVRARLAARRQSRDPANDTEPASPTAAAVASRPPR